MKLIFFLFILSTFTVTAQSNTKFEAIPVDFSDECQSTLLRATEGSLASDTAYLLPKAVLGVNNLGEQKFQIIKKSNGDYELFFSIYFPSSNKDIDLNDGTKILRLCYPKDGDSFLAQHKIKHLSHMAINNIDVAIDGLGSYSLASKETTIIDILGLYRNVRFKIGDENNLNDFLDELRSKSGVEVKVNFKFLARRSDGKINCDINAKVLAQKLEAAAKVPIKSVNVAAKTTYTNILKEIASKCSMEASSDPSFNKLAFDMAKDATTWWEKTVSDYNGNKPDACAIAPNSDDCRCSRLPHLCAPENLPGGNTPPSPIYTEEQQKTLDRCFENRFNEPVRNCFCKVWPSHTNCVENSINNSLIGENDSSSDSMPLPPKTEKEKSLALIDLTIMAEYFKSQGSINYNFERLAPATSETFNTPIIIKALDDFGSLNSITLAAEAVKSNKSLIKNLNFTIGNTLTIYPISKKTTDFIFNSEPAEYYNQNQVQSQRKFFSNLGSIDASKLKEKNGVATFVPYYYWKENLTRLALPTFLQLFKDIALYDEIKWGVINQKAEIKNNNFAQEITLSSMEDVYALQLGIAFSKKGSTIYKLNDPLLRNFITIDYLEENHAFIITAKENLGEIALHYIPSLSKKTIYPEKHFEEHTKKVVFGSNETKKIFSSLDKTKEVLAQSKSIDLKFQIEQSGTTVQDIQSILIKSTSIY